MKTSFYWLICLTMLLSVGLFTACDEEDGSVDTYANWKVRNDNFLDSIADVATRNESGQWERFLSYSIAGVSSDDDSSGDYDVTSYIYVEKLQDATPPAMVDGEVRRTLYTDSVDVNYRGWLINGTTFDESYTETELDYEIAVPSTGQVSDFVNGFTTALQEMHAADENAVQEDGTPYEVPWQYRGDRWLVYIPYQLAYDDSDRDDIPAYSVLIFDIALLRVWSIGESVPEWN